VLIFGAKSKIWAKIAGTIEGNKQGIVRQLVAIDKAIQGSLWHMMAIDAAR
jgi:hypothetical protein